jgi:ligand-binding sensor domain-containing protein
VSVTDRRRVLAASREGVWLYLIGEEAEMSDKPIEAPDRPIIAAETAWGSAKIDESRETVTFRIGDRAQVLAPSRGGLVSGLGIADGRVWVGHDHGIDVIKYDQTTGEVYSEERIRLDGPIVAMYPNRVGGGITYVSRFSGFGVIRLVDLDDPPIAAKGTRSAFDATRAAEAAVGESRD